MIVNFFLINPMILNIVILLSHMFLYNQNNHFIPLKLKKLISLIKIIFQVSYKNQLSS